MYNGDTMKKIKSIIKKLYRSRTEKMIAGVCGGIAEYYQVDPTLVRLLWAGLTLATMVAPGVILYLVAWIIIPEEK